METAPSYSSIIWLSHFPLIRFTYFWWWQSQPYLPICRLLPTLGHGAHSASAASSRCCSHSAAKLWGVQPQPLGMGLLGKECGIPACLEQRACTSLRWWGERQLCDMHSRVLYKDTKHSMNRPTSVISQRRRNKHMSKANKLCFHRVFCLPSCSTCQYPYRHSCRGAGQSRHRLLGVKRLCAHRFSPVSVRGRQRLHSLVTMDQSLLPGLCSLNCLFLLIAH